MFDQREGERETWADTEEKIKVVLNEKLQMQREVEVERAHCAGKPGGDKLLRLKDREDILKRTKSLKSSKIYVNEDVTDAVRRKRKEERGDIPFIRHDKLVIHPRTSTPKPARDA